MTTIKNSPGLEAQLRSTIKQYDTLPDKKKQELKKLDAACKDFESIFVYQLMKEMRKTIHKTGLTDGGRAEEIFSDMLDQERSKEMQVGISNMLFVQLSKAIVPNQKK